MTGTCGRDRGEKEGNFWVGVNGSNVRTGFSGFLPNFPPSEKIGNLAKTRKFGNLTTEVTGSAAEQRNVTGNGGDILHRRRAPAGGIGKGRRMGVRKRGGNIKEKVKGNEQGNEAAGKDFGGIGGQHAGRGRFGRNS